MVQLHAKRDRLEAELKLVRHAIDSIEALQTEEMLSKNSGTSEFIAKTAKSNTRERGSIAPAEIAKIAREILLDNGRPMKRGELVDALARRNVPLAGKDKNKNLGTILWRHQTMFVALDNLGYWVKGVPLEGVYTP